MVFLPNPTQTGGALDEGGCKGAAVLFRSQRANEMRELPKHAPLGCVSNIAV